MTTDEYLRQLRRAARGLPRARRRELVAEIEEHLREALAPGAGEAAVQTELDRLGAPAEIVAAEGGAKVSTGGAFEWIALVLLLVGGVVLPIVGWVVGVVMLWISRIWTWRQKLAGTLLVPGGLGGFLFLGLLAAGGGGRCSGPATYGPRGFTNCTPSSGPGVFQILLLVALVLAPITMSIYLGRQIKRVD